MHGGTLAQVQHGAGFLNLASELHRSWPNGTVQTLFEQERGSKTDCGGAACAIQAAAAWREAPGCLGASQALVRF